MIHLCVNQINITYCGVVAGLSFAEWCSGTLEMTSTSTHHHTRRETDQLFRMLISYDMIRDLKWPRSPVKLEVSQPQNPSLEQSERNLHQTGKDRPFDEQV